MGANSDPELEIGFNVYIQNKLLYNTFVVGASPDPELEIGFNVYIQTKLLYHTFVVGACSDLDVLQNNVYMHSLHTCSIHRIM